MLQPGQSAPDFELPDQDGRLYRLSAQPASWRLLVFYPGDNTPVCTRQLCEYRDGMDDFTGLGVEVIGISRDSAESHRQFREDQQLPFTLLTDADLEVAEAFGCKGMMGMKRAVFLIDPDRTCRYAHVEPVAIFRRSRAELVQAIEAAQAE